METKKDFEEEAREMVKKAELAFHAKLKQMELDMEFQNRASNRNRARSITLGTAAGGTTEIMLRGDGGKHMFMILQPVEVIELIHQLSANVGCHLALKPRDDFSSWRDWRISEAEKKHLNGHPPFVNDMAVFQQLGATGFNQEEAEKTVEKSLSHKEYEYVNGAAQVKKESKNEALATKKLKDGRKLKRASTSS